MITAEDNEVLTRVERGTPMGTLLRRYWMPALLSEEIASNDSDPKLVELLGERFVAFRDTEGRVGILPENCPHRGASLVLARNENCALRCLYHGWRMDVNGKVLETPNESERSRHRDHIPPNGLSVREAGGIVWAYLGPKELEPAFPAFEWTEFPSSQLVLTKLRQHCNWVQQMEGVLDSSHSNFLHADYIKPDVKVSVDGGRSVYDHGKFSRPSSDVSPTIRVKDTPYGFRYGAIRKVLRDEADYQYVRCTQFAAPFYVFIPGRASSGDMQAFVPIDSERTMFYYAHYEFEGPADAQEFQRWIGIQQGIDTNPDYSSIRNAENNWMQNRDKMRKGESTSGITGVLNEDLAVQESMGPIYDRTKEHLGAADAAISHMRRLMIASAKECAAGTGSPVGLAKPVNYSKIRAEDSVIPMDASWELVGAYEGE